MLGTSAVCESALCELAGASTPAVVTVSTPPLAVLAPKLPGSPWFTLAYVREPNTTNAAVAPPPPPSQPTPQVAPAIGLQVPGTPWYGILNPPSTTTSAAGYAPSQPQFHPPSSAPGGVDVHAFSPGMFPWLRSWPVEESMRLAKQTRTLFPGTPGGPPGSASGLPFLSRVPNPDDPDYNRRMARFTEKIHSIVNSLIGQKQLIQTGQSKWEISPAGGTPGQGSGLTGTFPT